MIRRAAIWAGLAGVLALAGASGYLTSTALSQESQPTQTVTIEVGATGPTGPAGPAGPPARLAPLVTRACVQPGRRGRLSSSSSRVKGRPPCSPASRTSGSALPQANIKLAINDPSAGLHVI